MSERYTVQDLPGTGDRIRAREGTALHESLGAANYWYRRSMRLIATRRAWAGVYIAIGILIGGCLDHWLANERAHDAAPSAEP
jgi:hypothetical protein